MRCRERSDQTSAFVEAEAFERVRWRIRIHLVTCRHCRHFVRQNASTPDTLGRLWHPPLHCTRKDELVLALREASR
jgi:hypothetical protein